jgi:hypothetical protein
MDVHKATIVAAVTAAGEVGKATSYGTHANTPAALEKLVKRLREGGSGPLKFRRSAEERQARCCQPGSAASGRAADSGLGAGSRA